MKQHEVLGHCPICEERLFVTRLSCTSCKTEINGQYVLNEFNYLEKELLDFAVVFLRNRGNIKEVEKELGVSYPTVRRLLDQTILALGYAVSTETVDRHDILERLEKGEMSIDEATERLKR